MPANSLVELKVDAGRRHVYRSRFLTKSLSLTIGALHYQRLADDDPLCGAPFRFLHGQILLKHDRREEPRFSAPRASMSNTNPPLTAETRSSQRKKDDKMLRVLGVSAVKSPFGCGSAALCLSVVSIPFSEHGRSR